MKPIDIILNEMTKEGYASHSVSVCQILLEYLTRRISGGVYCVRLNLMVRDLFALYLFLISKIAIFGAFHYSVCPR